MKAIKVKVSIGEKLSLEALLGPKGPKFSTFDNFVSLEAEVDEGEDIIGVRSKLRQEAFDELQASNLYYFQLAKGKIAE